MVIIMQVEGFEFPEDRYYLKNHVWLKEHNNKIRIGITDLGQSLSKEIVHIDLPEKKEYIDSGDTLVAYETIKAVSQITLPFDCKVSDVNEVLWEDPNKINEDCYGEWMVEVELAEIAQIKDLCMDVQSAATYYRELIKKERERYVGYDITT